MTSEKRVVRPYDGVHVFQDLLADARVRVGGRTVEPGQRLTIPASSFLHDPTVLVLAEDEEDVEKMRRVAVEAAEAMGFEAGHIEFLVLAWTPYLKLLDVVHRERLDRGDAIPRELRLIGDEEDLRALRTPFGGCEIEVSFCLADEQPPRPLRPRRRGTWLGRVRFKLSTQLGELGFTPRRLTSEKRAELDLPDTTIRYVEVDPSALLDEELDDAIDLYVDETILAYLGQAPDSASARSFQRQLFVDVVSAVVRAAPKVEGFDTLELAQMEESILFRIVDAAALPASGESQLERTARREKALKLLKTQPELFIARIEGAASMRDDVLAAVKGSDE